MPRAARKPQAPTGLVSQLAVMFNKQSTTLPPAPMDSVSIYEACVVHALHTEVQSGGIRLKPKSLFTMREITNCQVVSEIFAQTISEWKIVVVKTPAVLLVLVRRALREVSNRIPRRPSAAEKWDKGTWGGFAAVCGVSIPPRAVAAGSARGGETRRLQARAVPGRLHPRHRHQL